MKRLIIVIMAMFPFVAFGQSGTGKTCVSCIKNDVDLKKGASALGSYNISTGENSFAAGNNNSATGDYSIAMGINAIASGERAVAIGQFSKADGSSSTAIGPYSRTSVDADVALAIGGIVSAEAAQSMVLGFGAVEHFLINDIENSLMIGFGSELPTLFVSESPGLDKTGKVGIGNITDPQAKLHIRADNNEYASLFLEPTSSNKFGKLMIGDQSNYIQAKAQNNMVFHTSSGHNFLFGNGNVGIGTSAPSAKLDVNGTMEVNGDATFSQNLTVAGESHLNGIVLNDDADITGADQIVGFNDLRLSGDNDGGTDLFISADGKVGIGTTSIPSDYILAIKGNAIAEKMKVQYYGNWFDYVFDEDYELPDLYEVDNHIKTNGHLQGIPSEQDVHENGIDLGQMDGLLLKKIEELTLYTIEQQKQIDKLKSELDKLSR